MTAFFQCSESFESLCSQMRPASSVHPARSGSSVLTLNSAWKTYRTMSDCFHAERDLVAH